MRVALRDYQQQALDAIRLSMRTGHRAPLLVAPTGSGKTTIFSAITEGAALKGKRVYILVHRAELLMQASASLDRLGVPHGLISPQFGMTADHVQVASVQTIVRRLAKLPAPDMVIIDECHHATAGSWRKVIDQWPRAKLFGVTATPARLDGQGLGVHCGGVFDDLVLGPSYSELQAMGYLVTPRVMAPPSALNTDDVHKTGGDLNRAELEVATDKPVITGSAVEHYNKLAPGAKAVAFCVGLKHAAHVTEAFKSAGYQWAQIDGTLGDVERKQIIRDLERGYLHGISSIDVVSEGFDLPDISVGILLRKTLSLGLFIQQCGRVLRPAPGKDSALILDHVGNSFYRDGGELKKRHGLPDEDREWSLDGKQGRKKKDDEEENIKQCKTCFAVFSIRLDACPECGTPIPTPQPRKPPAVVEGELTEIDRAMQRRTQRREEGSAQTFEDFQRIAAARGYNPAWARIRWKLRQQRLGAQA